MVRGAQILLLPLIVGSWIEAALFGAERWFSGCAELLSVTPGWPGHLLRKGFYGATLRGCAVRVSIAFGTLIVHRDAVVGHGVSIGSYCIIGCADIALGRLPFEHPARGPMVLSPRRSMVRRRSTI